MKTIIFFFMMSVLLGSSVAQKWVLTKGQAVFHEATASTNAYSILTNGTTYSYGSLFINGTIDLNQPFNYSFKLYFGDKDANGADGMTFVIHSDPRGAEAIGCVGMGLGYGDSPHSNDWLTESSPLQNSIAIEFDTYQNSAKNDPSQDHIAYVENGDNDHSHYPASFLKKMPNLEDDAFHTITISWNPTLNKLIVLYDLTSVLEINRNLRLIIGNNAFMGFTSTTGGLANRHVVEDINSPLPVDLLSFNGKYDQRLSEVSLSWKTASEVNNSHFIIQKSYDGFTYDNIGLVQGSGNSNEAKDYYFNDKGIDNAGIYYRLVQYDFDGTEDVFDPIYISIKKDDWNPQLIQDNGSLIFNSSLGSRYAIFSMDGRLYSQGEITQDNQRIFLNFSVDQVYIVSIINGSNSRSIKISLN